MEPDYIIPIQDIGRPLKYAIRMNDIAIFNILHNKKDSYFRKWCDQNLDNIHNKIFIQNKITIDSFNDYFEMPIDEIATNIMTAIKYYRGEFTESKTEQLFTREGLLVKGGFDINDITENGIKSFCVAIPFYLYSPADINQKMVPPLDSGSMGIQYGGTIEDISGEEKKEERLVYLIGLNNYRIVLKITPAINRYIKEIQIYDELNNFAKKDPKLKNKIVEKYSTLTTPIIGLDKYEFSINIKGNNEKILILETDKEYFNAIREFSKRHQDKIVFLALEYNPDFKTLYHINTNGLLNESAKCKLAENVIKLLVYLNNKLGFSHWDLHGGNLLVEPITLDFKLFDFDLSSTNKNDNDSHFRLLYPDFFEPQKPGVPKPPKPILYDNQTRYGLVYDVYQLIFNLEINTCNNSVLQEIITKISQDVQKYNIIDFESLNRAVRYNVIEHLIKNIGVSLSGGNYYAKYRKYKMKYLNLKITLSI